MTIAAAGFEDKRNESKHGGSLWNLEREGKRFLPWSLQKEHNPGGPILEFESPELQENKFALLRPLNLW